MANLKIVRAFMADDTTTETERVMGDPPPRMLSLRIMDVGTSKMVDVDLRLSKEDYEKLHTALGITSVSWTFLELESKILWG